MTIKPPIFVIPMSGNEAQQFLHRARMFRDATIRLVDYTSGGQNWPKYALLMHAIELSLKAYAKQREMHGATLGKPPANHDLQAWYDLAIKLGLKDDRALAQNIAILSELHFSHYTRYPQKRSDPVPDLSGIADETAEYLISTITQTVNPR